VVDVTDLDLRKPLHDHVWSVKNLFRNCFHRPTCIGLDCIAGS